MGLGKRNIEMTALARIGVYLKKFIMVAHAQRQMAGKKVITSTTWPLGIFCCEETHRNKVKANAYI